MKLTTKIILTATLAIVLIVLPTTVVCNYVVNSNADGRLYYDAASAPQAEVGLLLGTTPQRGSANRSRRGSPRRAPQCFVTRFIHTLFDLRGVHQASQCRRPTDQREVIFDFS